MAPGAGGQVGGDGIDHQSAKHVLDRIGEEVYKEVKSEAAGRGGSDLKGFLTSTTILGGETVFTDKPCDLIKEKRENLIGANNERYPCRKSGEDVKRFSDKRGAQCDKKKIKDSEKDGVGACAPFRRLNLCNKNFQNMNSKDSSKAKNDLLLEVCMAAYYEGDSIKTHYTPYQHKYVNSGSTICTVLARSFADIGDIVRGRDLYLGKKKKNQNETKTERDQLEQKLKGIFEKIYNDVTSSGRNKRTNGAEARYNGDKNNNFFQLREDWWNANRAKVWEAITCNDDKKLTGASYFRPTCGGGKSSTDDKCRCDGSNADPPTYFDYVPQYLRWFEEWSEDFCRKKKHKLNDAIQKCRGEDGSGEERYCDLNGYDCKKTKRGRNIYRWDYKCAGCFLSCSHFRTWIDNQKEQFLKQKEQFDKQKKKYETEISGGSGDSRRQTRSAGGTTATNYEEYEKKFYEKFKGKCGTVGEFLEKLSKETACEKQPQDGEKISSINFTNANTDEIFSPTEYCQACPLCGVKPNGGTWERLDDMNDCPPINLYKPKSDKVGTPINFLYSGDEPTEIGKKLKKFCDQTNGDTTNSGGSGDCGGNIDSSLCEPWKCYQPGELTKDYKLGGMDDEDYEKDVTTGGGLCILENKNKNKGSESNPQNNHADIQKTFNPFFYYWVVHMLKDSIHWRTEKIKGCLENGKAIKCTDKCKRDCGCFKRWVEQKGKEWENIKKHFKTQKLNHTGGNGNQGGLMVWSHDDVLEGVLDKDLLLKSLREAYGDTDDIKRIDKMLQDTGVLGGGSGGENKTTIDKLLKHEGDHANECLRKQEECEKKAQQESRGRSHSPPASASDEVHDEDDEDEEDNNEEEEEEGGDGAEVQEEPLPEDQDTAEATTENQGGKTPKVEDNVKPCDIVNTLFTSDTTTLQEACPTKYGPKAPTSWKCIPSGDKTATSGNDATTGGSICVPPRRRRLYVGKLETLDTDSALQNDNKTASDKLRDAFIQSAAVETFFLWDRYKKERELKKAEERLRSAVLSPFSGLPASNEMKALDGVGIPRLPSGMVGEVQSQELKLLSGTLESDNSPQSKLLNGEIPPDFLRLMFYTLADYKDILDGKNIVADILNGSSGSDKEMADREQNIKTAIQKFFEQSGNNQETRGHPPSLSGKKTTPKKWWDQNVESIWNGMICALTYKDNSETGPKGKTPTQIEDADKVLAKLKTQYGDYDKVQLKEQNDTEAKKATASQTTLLSNFVKRPPYFRYLEEWGESFCRERTRMLKDVRDNCLKSDGVEKKCDGDGFECTQTVTNEDETIKGFDYSTCARHCRWYKRWIEKKKIEFEEQKKAYDKQKTDAEGNNDYSGFHTTLKTCLTTGDFLERLKNGPCKKDNDNGNNSGEDEIDFKEKVSETFKHANNCGPCSKFRIKCENANCTGSTKVKCNGRTDITQDDIEESENFTEVVGMVVSDNRGNKFEGEGLNEACKNANIFKGFRDDKWKCGKVCGLDVCGLKKVDINGKQNENQIIIIRALFKRWLEHFFDDYNKIRKKLKPCIENGNEEEQKCFKGCKDKCECVKKWLELKRTEWGKIKKHYLKQFSDNYSEKSFAVKTFLEEVIPQIAVVNDQNKVKNVIILSKFDKSCVCSADVNAQKDSNQDAIECMLKKLQKKIEECQKKHDENGDKTCSPPPQQTLDLDDDEPTALDEDDDKKVGKPSFCKIDEPPEPVDEETCKAADENVAETERETTAGPTGADSTPLPGPEGGDGVSPPQEIQTDSEKPPEDTDTKDPGQQEQTGPKNKPLSPPARSDEKSPPKPNPPPPYLSPPLKTALMTSTLVWSVGIGFAAFTYFFLKVLYIYVYMFIYMYLCICMCGYIWIYIYIYMYMYIYVCMYMCFLYMYVWVCLDIYMWMYMCFWIYIYICICVSVYVCVLYIYFIYMYLY